MNKVQYRLNNDAVINHDFGGNMVTINDISYLATKYYELTDELPTTVFIGVHANSELSINMLGQTCVASEARQYVHVNTSCGMLLVRVVAHPSSTFLMIGQDIDYARYRLDDVFEEEVLTK